MINFYTEDISKPKLLLRPLKSWIKLIVNANNFNIGELSIIFCSNNYILNINKKFLCHDYFTDIITFNYNEANLLSGDIFISLETVTTNAVEFGAEFDVELRRVIIHGILHLIGFDDLTDDDKKVMRQHENLALLQFIS